MLQNVARAGQSSTAPNLKPRGRQQEVAEMKPTAMAACTNWYPYAEATYSSKHKILSSPPHPDVGRSTLYPQFLGTGRI